ncbi:MAG: 6-bladed beta-propeller [Gemmatimonadota bacterium]|nr:MAG: 6-bladed beta-propeller [Gemmatimonadota bacterium]
MNRFRSIPHGVLIVLTTIQFAASGCASEGARGELEWVAEWDTVGDTVIVHTISGSMWGQPREMEAVLSIGVLDGAEELMFGSLQQIAVDDDGSIYAFDGQVPALRRFDAAGAYVGTIGRDGAGPGEYQSFATGLAIRSDGKMVLLDPQNTRINVYEPDGTHFAHWPVQGGFFSRQGLVVDAEDHTYVQILTGTFASDEPLPTGYLHLSANGATIDTIVPPRFPGEPKAATFRPFGPSKVLGMTPFGHLIVGMNDDYRFDIRSPDGTVVRVERDYEPVALLSDEKADWQAIYDWFDENQPFGEIGSVPDYKPPYAQFLSAQDGRIWVRRRAEGYKEEEEEEPQSEESNQPPPMNWEEQSIYDVFELDGTYLGEVRFPLRASPLFVRADTAWGVYRGEFDEQYIAKLVMNRAERSAP